MMKEDVAPRCLACGENPVNHSTEWFSALIESLMGPVGTVIDRLTGRLRGLLPTQFIDRWALPSFRALAALHIGTLSDEANPNDSGRNRWLWDSASRRGIVLHQFRVAGRLDGTSFFTAVRGDTTIAFEGLPRPDNRVSPSLNWMDNKATMKKKFIAAGIPVARGRACATYARALRTFHEVGAPVIVKPHIGSRGRHTTIHITDPETLRAAFLSARQLSPWVVVEQELRGRVFRVLLVRGAVAAIVRREEPYVTGDGVATVRELVLRENKNPARHTHSFHEILMDEEAERELTRQGLRFDAVPAAGREVSLNTHVSRYYGASTTDFTDRAHPDNIALFERVARTLDDSLVGVDFIIEDMERSWREQKLCGVIECNSLPSIDLHHDVLYGKNRDIAGMLLDIAFENMIR
jgi:D-alanine-D-alanine ligase-like ATP-grasp enzyme